MQCGDCGAEESAERPLATMPGGVPLFCPDCLYAHQYASKMMHAGNMTPMEALRWLYPAYNFVDIVVKPSKTAQE